MSFTGNMSGMLILEYILSQRKALGILPENGAVVTTIVSGKMAGEITKAYGVDLIETLTGFKYIGEQIHFFEQSHEHEYIFGYEESYGCLAVARFRDYKADVILDCVKGTRTAAGLPNSNVLYFELENGAWCCIRPSGTEPKMKFYIGVRGADEETAEKKLAELTEGVKALI